VKATAVLHNIALAYDPEYAVVDDLPPIDEGNDEIAQPHFDGLHENFQRRAQIVQMFGQHV
jgi:hypothetical protein